jgi:FkbM family methyltransferase
VSLRRWQRAWKRYVWSTVLRHVRPEIEVTVGDRRIRVDLRDQVIGSLLYVQGDYEAELLRLIDTMDLRGSVCVDIGANIGLHSLAMSCAVGRTGKVFAFEPEAHNFHLLQHNLQANGASNVIPQQLAAGDAPGSCRLVLNPRNYGDHRVCTADVAGRRFQEVPLTTVDVCLQDVPDGAVGLVKIDVQGYECQVLRGMRGTMERNPEMMLILEIFPEGLQATGKSATQLMQMVRDFGFIGWEFHDHRVLPVSDPWVYDLIRDGRHVDVILSRNRKRLWAVLENYLHEVSSNGIYELGQGRAHCA